MTKEHKYCYMCQMFHGCAFNNCHGRQFYRQDLNRQGMNQGSYIPNSIEDQFEAVERLTGEYAKHLTPLDENKIGVNVIVLSYKGYKPRETLQEVHIWRADIGKSGKVFTDIYLKECLDDPMQQPHPIRAKRKGNRIFKINK